MYLAYDQSRSSQKLRCIWDVEVFHPVLLSCLGGGGGNEAVMAGCDTSEGITPPLLTSQLSSREGWWDGKQGK